MKNLFTYLGLEDPKVSPPSRTFICLKTGTITFTIVASYFFPVMFILMGKTLKLQFFFEMVGLVTFLSLFLGLLMGLPVFTTKEELPEAAHRLEESWEIMKWINSVSLLYRLIAWLLTAFLVLLWGLAMYTIPKKPKK